MQIFGRVVAVFLVLLGFAPFSNVVADTTQVFYGKLHISADAIQFEKSKEDRKLLSSNSTRVGFKGSEELGETMKAIWKLEGGLDLTGETSGFTVRNRYLGLINPLGMVVAGVHDTPYKSLGAKFDIMPNTIADRRSILGNVNGTRYLDNRAENALMYVSHVISGLELRFMASSGGAQEEGTEGGIDKNPVNSFSAIYKGNAGFLGAAYEENVNVGVDGVRLAAGFALTASKMFIVYEQLGAKKDGNNLHERASYGLSAMHRISNTTLKIQALRADDYFESRDSSGTLLAAGITQHLGKQVDLYTVVARMDNKKTSEFPLRGSSSPSTGTNGEFYATDAAGSDITGVSLGMVYTF